MRSNIGQALRLAVAGALLALGGCVAYPAEPYYGGGYYAAPAPVVVAPTFGGFGYYGHGGWGHGWHGR